MSLTAVGLAGLCFLAGVLTQRRFPSQEPIRQVWALGYWVIAPLAVFAGFILVPLQAQLAGALAAVIISSYVTLLVAYGYARAVARDRSERAALTLAGAFGNSGTLGFPFALILFGPSGLALMIVSAQLAWLVPQTAVSTAVARFHAVAQWSGHRRLQAVLVSPPLIAACVALVTRSATYDLRPTAQALATGTAVVAAPYGFYLLGLSIPLGRAVRAAGDLWRAAGAVAIRLVCGPVLLVSIAVVTGLAIPGAFYLGAAMPCAFHLVTLSRVFELRPQLMRLVVGSSAAFGIVVIAVYMTITRY